METNTQGVCEIIHCRKITQVPNEGSGGKRNIRARLSGLTCELCEQMLRGWQILTPQFVLIWLSQWYDFNTEIAPRGGEREIHLESYKKCDSFLLSWILAGSDLCIMIIIHHEKKGLQWKRLYLLIISWRLRLAPPPPSPLCWIYQ